MSSGLKAQLKTLLDAKEYRAAIVLLQSSSMPDKNVYIERIQKRIDEAAKTDDDKLKAHIAAGEYVQARELLQRIDHPKKAVMLAELDRRLSGTPAVPAPAKKSRYTVRGMLVFVVFAFVMVCGAAALAFNLSTRDAGRALSIEFRVAEVCREVYRDNYYDEQYTANQFVEGCHVAASHAIASYEEEVNYCYDRQNETLARFMECLADNNFKLSDIWLINASKE